MVASLLLLALVSDSFFRGGAPDRIGRGDGVAMLVLYILLIGYTIRQARRRVHRPKRRQDAGRWPDGSWR